MIKILAFVMKHVDRTLMESCKEVIVGHFEDCPDSVPGLPETAFLQVQARDELNVVGKEVVFRAIIRWYEAHQLKSDCPALAGLPHDVLRKLYDLQDNEFNSKKKPLLNEYDYNRNT